MFNHFAMDAVERSLVAGETANDGNPIDKEE
nr:hypothetical protein [Tanacetum cinerariifolium]